MPGSFTSGLGSQLVVGKEATYGAAATPSKAFEYTSESVKLARAFLMSTGLRAGRMFQSAPRRTPTTRDVAGSINLEVPSQGFGTLLDMLHGLVVAPVQQATTTAYKQTHLIGTSDPFAKSLTAQIGRPDVQGVVVPHTYPGCKVGGMTFACNVGELLTCQVDVNAQDEVYATPLVVPAYPSGLHSFAFTQGTLTVDGTAAANVSTATVTVTMPWKTDRYYLGNTGLKQAPLVNAYATVQVSLTVDWQDGTLYDKFKTGNTLSSVILDFVGPTIASTYNEEIKFTMPASGWDGDTPNVGGPDVLNYSPTLDVLDNGVAAPLTIDYVSTDVTL